MYIAGLDGVARADEPEFDLGTFGASASDGTEAFIYVQASGAIAVNKVAQIRANYQAVVSTTEQIGAALGLLALPLLPTTSMAGCRYLVRRPERRDLRSVRRKRLHLIWIVQRPETLWPERWRDLKYSACSLRRRLRTTRLAPFN